MALEMPVAVAEAVALPKRVDSTAAPASPVRLPEGLVLLSLLAAGEEGSGLGLVQVVSLLAGEGDGLGLVQLVPLPAGDGDGVQLVLLPAAGEAAGTPLLRVW
jgi:hypothetical protein